MRIMLMLRRVLVTLSCVAASLSAAAGATNAPAAAPVVLSGHVHPLAQPRFDVGAVPNSLPMAELKLVLRRSAAQDAALQQLLTAQQTAGSPQYHQWLTPAQFGARYGAGTQEMQAASDWLRAQGFKIGAVPTSHSLLPFSGTAAQVQTAFQTSIHYFLVDGVKHFANTTNPQIPAALSSLVSSIRGLHDFRPKPDGRTRVIPVPKVKFGNNNYVTPADYAVIYDFVPLYKGNISGAGVTIAVAEQSDIDQTIPANYWSVFGVNQGQQLSSVAAAAATDPGRTNDGNESEAYLDLEIIGGLAPAAKLILVRDKNVTTAFDYAVNNNLAAVVSISFSTCESALGRENASISSTFQQAAAQGITVVVSSGDSGIAECDTGIHDKQGSTVLTGLSVNGLASTPYNVAVGGTDFNPILVNSGDYWNTTNSPGTYANAKSYIPEMVWNESCVNPVTAQSEGATNLLAFCNNATYADLDLISGGGGGVSSCTSAANSGACAAGYAQPAWQTGVAGLQGLTTRAIPDVAMLANNWVTCDQSVSTCGPPSGTIEVSGGTSAAAPAMAAIVALLDEALISKTSADGRQGNINPTLYRLAAAEYGTSQTPNSASLTSCNSDNGALVGATCVFNDVTTGSNGQPCNVSKFALGGSLPASTCTSQSGDTYGIVMISSTVPYSAGAAYDLATGLGSVNAANLVQTIAGLKSPSGLSAVANGTTVNLTWTASANATSYDVYEGTSSGAEGTAPVQTGISGTSAALTGLQAGQTYYFLVAAVTASGTSLPSNEANATLLPAAPAGLTTSGTAAAITLTWNASSGANSYSVLEGTAAGAESSTPVASGVTATSITLAGTAGITDYFKVIAVNHGGSSPVSSEVSGTVLPTSPGGLNATGGNASVVLAWTAGQGATSYSIFQGATAGAETSAAVLNNVTGTSATVGGLANTTKYYFKVTSVNSAGSSAPSAEASATTTTPSSGGGGALTAWQLLVMGLWVGICIKVRAPRMPCGRRAVRVRVIRTAWVVLAGVAGLSLGTHAFAETRVALIIGNSAYQKPDMRLPNPANDARAMAEKLQSAGFVTIVRYNAKRADFYHALNEFSDKIGRDPHAVGLFYYAGHAVQADGINYLIPVDAEIEAQSDLEPNAFDAGRVLKSMTAAQNEMNIVILDACRNNPLPKTRGMDRGLARIDAPSGTFIAFSAGPGQTAQDGAAGSNGVFTGEFLKAMSEPGLPLEQVFKKVVIGVKAATRGAQTPWQESSIQGDFSFYPKGAVGAALATASATSSASASARHVDNANELEQGYWDRIKDSSDPADFKDYKSQYPNGAHIGEATLLLRKTNRTTAANTPSIPASQAASVATRGAAAPTSATAAASAARSPVEPGAQGTWTMKMPSPQGISTCYWDVKASGTYNAWCVGAVPVAHAGNVSVADGRWTLNATTTNYSDGGTYVFSNPDTMVMTGKLGTGAWLRTK